MDGIRIGIHSTNLFSVKVEVVNNCCSMPRVGAGVNVCVPGISFEVHELYPEFQSIFYRQ